MKNNAGCQQSLGGSSGNLGLLFLVSYPLLFVEMVENLDSNVHGSGYDFGREAVEQAPPEHDDANLEVKDCEIAYV